MADIELLIKIPEDVFKRTVFYREFRDLNDCVTTIKALESAMPLPKGHRRLGDLSKVYDKLNEAQVEGTEEYKGLGEAKQIVCDAPTIIEADKEYEAEVITRGNCMMCGKELTEGLFFCKECENKAKQKVRDK